jgi:hypothetical protein
MSGLDPEKVVTLEVRGRVAIITLCNEKKLNAMTQDTYFRLSQLLRQVAKMDEVFITVLTAKGRFFSALVYSPPSRKKKRIKKPNQQRNYSLTMSQRSRRLHLPRTHRRRPLQAMAHHLRRQQHQHHPSLLLAPQDPRHSPQRPRRRPLRRPHRLLRLHLRRPTRLHLDPLHIPRPRSRGRRQPRFRPEDGHRQGQRGSHHEQAHHVRGAGQVRVRERDLRHQAQRAGEVLGACVEGGGQQAWRASG